MDTPLAPPPPAARDRVRRLMPRSRVLAALLLAAALLAFVLALLLGRSSAQTPAPLQRATPLTPSSQAVEIRGLPATRALPALRPQPEPTTPKPVVIVGEG